MSDLLPIPAWSSVHDSSVAREASPRPDADEGVDRSLVIERVHRYGWAYDERQSELLGACFTQNATWEGSIMGRTPVGPFAGRAAIVEFLTGFWAAQGDQRRHIFTNTVIDEISAVSAQVRAYLLLTSARDESMTPVTTGPYRISMVKEAGVWRISRLVGGWDAPFQ